MNLIDLKLPKKAKEEVTEAPTVGDQPDYPYGMQLIFEKEQVDRIKGLQGMEAGETVNIEAVGYVRSVMVEDTEDGGRHRVEIQLMKVGVKTKKRPEDMDAEEYRDFRRGKKG